MENQIVENEKSLCNTGFFIEFITCKLIDLKNQL